MIEKLKAIAGDSHYAFDKDKVYDMTMDCLRAFYAHCVYLSLEIVGVLVVKGLEHKKYCLNPTKELEEAYNLGKKLVALISKKDEGIV
jgi:hypothetical protein